MKASDLYGGGGIGTATTQETTNPVPAAPTQKAQAQAVATAQPLKNSYGIIALLAIVGILLGAKFALEKR